MKCAFCKEKMARKDLAGKVAFNCYCQNKYRLIFDYRKLMGLTDYKEYYNINGCEILLDHQEKKFYINYSTDNNLNNLFCSNFSFKDFSLLRSKKNEQKINFFLSIKNKFDIKYDKLYNY